MSTPRRGRGRPPKDPADRHTRSMLVRLTPGQWVAIQAAIRRAVAGGAVPHAMAWKRAAFLRAAELTDEEDAE